MPCFLFYLLFLESGWSTRGFAINFNKWGTQTISTEYVTKDSAEFQSWETFEITKGGTPEVVLQDRDVGIITDGQRIYLDEGNEYTWLTDLSKTVGNKYRLNFKKNGYTIGMASVTGFWSKY